MLCVLELSAVSFNSTTFCGKSPDALMRVTLMKESISFLDEKAPFGISYDKACVFVPRRYH